MTKGEIVSGPSRSDETTLNQALLMSLLCPFGGVVLVWVIERGSVSVLAFAYVVMVITGVLFSFLVAGLKINHARQLAASGQRVPDESWVVTEGEYDDEEIVAAYTSLEAALTAYPQAKWREWQPGRWHGEIGERRPSQVLPGSMDYPDVVNIQTVPLKDTGRE